MPEGYYIIPMVSAPYSRENPQRPMYVDEIRCNWTGHNVDELGVYVCKVNTTEAKHTDLASRAGVRQLPRDYTWGTVISTMPPVARNFISKWCTSHNIAYDSTETIGQFLQRVINSGLFSLGNIAVTTQYQNLTQVQKDKISNLCARWNIVLPLERGYLTLFKQILAGLEALDTDVVFHAEHDILYHASHFDFVPTERDKIYYNKNCWKLRVEDGFCLYYDCGQTSQLCAYRETLVQHYRQRVKNTEAAFEQLGDTRAFRNFIRQQGFEPGTHHREGRVDDLNAGVWESAFPNVDIRHDHNLTPNRWRQDQFNSHRSCRNWIESDTIPYWGKGIDIVRRLI